MAKVEAVVAEAKNDVVEVPNNGKRILTLSTSTGVPIDTKYIGLPDPVWTHTNTGYFGLDPNVTMTSGITCLVQATPGAVGEGPVTVSATYGGTPDAPGTPITKTFTVRVVQPEGSTRKVSKGPTELVIEVGDVILNP